MKTPTQWIARKLKYEQEIKDNRDFLYELLSDPLFGCFNKKCRFCDNISECTYRPGIVFRNIKERLDNVN